jgi:HK97 gp10 family phage protein
MPVSVKIRGGAETARALQQLGRNSAQEKVLRQALRPGARAIADAAKANAPEDTGALRASIAVGIRQAPPRHAHLVVGHRTDDPAQRWRISHIIEFGSRFMGAQPYMRPAANLGGYAIQLFGENLWPLIAREATRVAARGATRRRR